MRDFSSLSIKLGGTTALLLAMLCSEAVYANETQVSEFVYDGEGIVVTARRSEEKLQDVPISITLLSQNEISQKNIVTATDLATYTPSLSTNNRYGTEKASFSIRGFTQEAGTAPSVAVYLGDVVAPRSASSLPSGNGVIAGTLFDLENIQVLKGPQGTLFGRNTTGGMVILTPHRATDRFEGYLEGSVGNYGLRQVQAVVNAPLSDRVRLRVGVDRMQRDGYLKNRSEIGPKAFADVDYWGARATLSVNISEHVKNTTIATFNRSNTNGALARLIACRENPELRTGSQVYFAQAGCDQIARQEGRGDRGYDVESSIADPYIHSKQWQISNTTEIEISPFVKMRNILSYGEFRERARINTVGDNGFIPDAFIVNKGTAQDPLWVEEPTGALAGQSLNFLTASPGASGIQASQSTMTEELQFQGKAVDGRLDWQAGIYFEISNPIDSATQNATLFLQCANVEERECVDPLSTLTGRPFGVVSMNDLEYKFQNYAVYFQANYKVTDTLNLTGGLRYTYDWTAGQARNSDTRFADPENPTYSCTKTGIVLASLDDRDACYERYIEESGRPTWLLGVDYKPLSDLMIYAKYSRGYRQGVVNLIPTGAAYATVAPEKVDSYEIGAKYAFYGPVKGTFNIALFDNAFKDQQIQASAVAKPGMGSGANILLNAGESSIRGVEVDGSISLASDLKIGLGYTYLNAKLKSINVPVVNPDSIYQSIIPTAIAGQELAYSPKHKLTLTGSYALPLPKAFGGVELSMTYTYTSNQWSNRTNDRYVSEIGYNPGRSPSTNLLNLNLSITDPMNLPIDILFFASNLTNQRYRTAITGGYPTMGYESELLGAPRMFGTKLRVRF